MTKKNSFSRRKFVGLTGLTATGALLGLTSSCKEKTNEVPDLKVNSASNLKLDLSKSEDNLFAMVKIKGNLDSKLTYDWGHGEVYGALPNEIAIPMLKFQSCRVSRYFKQEDGSYLFRYRGMIFYQDYETGEFIENYKNPITKKVVKVKNWRSSIGKYYYTKYGAKSVAAFKRESKSSKEENKPYVLPWQQAGDHIWVSLDERVRYKRPSDGVWRVDNAIMRYQSFWSDLINPEITSARTTTSWHTAIDWFTWLDMESTPGRHMQGGIGAKFDSIEQLPTAFLSQAEKTYPGILTDPLDIE